MIEQSTTIGSTAGLHARPAAAVTRIAKTLTVPVTLNRPGGPRADARSLLAILALGISFGDDVIVRTDADGDEAQRAVDELANALSRELDDDTATK